MVLKNFKVNRIEKSPSVEIGIKEILAIRKSMEESIAGIPITLLVGSQNSVLKKMKAI